MAIVLHTVEALTSLAARMYGTKSRRKIKWHSNPGIQKRLEITNDEPRKEVESETMDEDTIEFESDLMDAHRSHHQHKRELAAAREKTKLRIVGRKYFKEFEPSLLTFTEKEQIKFLHEQEPTEWTPEKLSESFPALSSTIRKILKSKWVPKNVDRVLKHDQDVIENWKKFKKGELPVDPQLRMHLAKFKDRKISLSNTQDIAKKVVPTQFTFPKPASNLFSSVIQSYNDQKNTGSNCTDKSDVNVRLAAGGGDHSKTQSVTYKDDVRNVKVLDSKTMFKTAPGYDSFVPVIESDGFKKSNRKQDLITFDKFIKDSLENIDANTMPSVQEKVLMDVHRRRIESEKSLETMSNASELDIGGKKVESADIQEDHADKGLQTYVKERRDKTGGEPSKDYPDHIAIPKTRSRRGLTYRLADCFYDDDGEFLYRVPGFKN